MTEQFKKTHVANSLQIFLKLFSYCLSLDFFFLAMHQHAFVPTVHPLPTVQVGLKGSVFRNSNCYLVLVGRDNFSVGEISDTSGRDPIEGRQLSLVTAATPQNK